MLLWVLLQALTTRRQKPFHQNKQFSSTKCQGNISKLTLVLHLSANPLKEIVKTNVVQNWKRKNFCKKWFYLDFHVSYHNIGYGPPKNIHIWLGHESGQGQAQPISRGRGGREEGKGSSLYYYLSSYGGLVREIFFQYTDNISSTKIAHVFISYLLFKNCFLSVFTP